MHKKLFSSNFLEYRDVYFNGYYIQSLNLLAYMGDLCEKGCIS